MARRRIFLVPLCLLLLVFLSFLYNNFFIFNRYLYTHEPTKDESENVSCQSHTINQTDVFRYAFTGCQMSYEVSKALHPTTTFISDKGSKGDIILSQTYSYNNLATKNREFIHLLCSQKYYDKYKYFFKTDDDSFIDHLQAIDPDFHIGCNIFSKFCAGMAVYYSADLLKLACNDLSILDRFVKHDDVQLSEWLFDALAKNNLSHKVCSFRDKFIIHKQYQSKRLNLFFTPYLKCPQPK
ncbi:hypothetical protein AYI70_g8067 [Smittium culicis]|uniref:Hexosyltransferase n=1 Tax=Smittium culicis TaxID=133412 RepID=A0A1R1XHL9_9FUNG|nr:hypothetical protein AYI70_g8067 [Smittium culicis]